MPDLSFYVETTAQGKAREREGLLVVDGHEIRYSVPGSMGGKGVGASPETLLIAAVTACYSLTMLAYLRKYDLPFADLGIRTEGIVEHPQHRYARITVNPTVRGADASRMDEYRSAAVESRDHCFIGQTVAAGGVAYEVGEVRLA